MSTTTETITKPNKAAAATPATTESAPAAVVADQGVEGAAEAQTTNIKGRSVFAIETTGAGVVVRTAFMTEDNRLLDMPAVFPDMMYAFNVIDDLKRQVAQHFSQAAQVGAQVIANQARAQQAAASQEQADAPAKATKQVETTKK
jgi:hypothetical protein